MVITGIVFLRHGARPMSRRISTESILFLFISRKYGLPIMYIFFVLMRCILFFMDEQDDSLNELMITILFAMPLFIGFVYGLSGLAAHWSLNDLLSHRYKEGKEIDSIYQLKRSIWRWRLLHRYLFKINGINIDDIFQHLEIFRKEI